jgi:transglutaminase-like putative cysteine protease
VQREQQEGRSYQWSWDMLLWTLLLLMVVPVVLALGLLPWSQHLPNWTIPAIALIGTAVGFLLSYVPLRSRWWWSFLIAVPAVGAAVSLGALIAANENGGGATSAEAALFGAYTAALTACVPLLALQARQGWLSVGLIWVTLVGAWGLRLSSQQIWQLISILVLSLVFLGLSHLREEVRFWDTEKLQRLGPVLWPSARAILLLSLLIALVGLIPLSSNQLALLNQVWRNSLLAHGGPLTYAAPNGTPVAVLGAPLDLNAPNVGGSQIILSYEILSGPQNTSAYTPLPALFGTSLDAFDGRTWQQSAQTTTVSLSRNLTLPQGAQLLRARITVGTLPPMSQGSLLIGFDQPLGFSVPAQATVFGASSPDSVGIANWQTTANLAKTKSYTVNSAILPESAAGAGVLPPALIQQMTSTPASLTTELHTTALAWVGKATTPTEQAHSLLTSFQKQMTLDPSTKAPPGVSPVEWSLQNRRGNVLQWTTDYILLGRSIGLPMRLAEGYLPGSYDAHLHTIVVRASDATVWAQLAIPGMGWLDLFPASTTVKLLVPSKVIYKSALSPTPSPTTHPQSTRSVPGQNPETKGAGGNPTLGFWVPALVVLTLAFALIILVVTAALASWRWSRFGSELPPLLRFFVRLRALARLAGVGLRPSDTATQATLKVTAYVPDQAETLFSLNAAYERTRYGEPMVQQGIGDILTGLQKQWRRLQRALVGLIVTRPWRNRHERGR